MKRKKLKRFELIPGRKPGQKKKPTTIKSGNVTVNIEGNVGQIIHLGDNAEVKFER